MTTTVEQLPEWLCNASWRGTGLKMIVHGKDEDDALQRCWSQVMKMQGGAMCLDVTIVRKIGKA